MLNFEYNSKDSRWIKQPNKDENTESVLFVEFEATAYEEDDVQIDDITIFSEDLQTEIKFEDLSKEDQMEIESMCQEIADNNGYELWLDRMIGQAESMNDFYEDR